MTAQLLQMKISDESQRLLQTQEANVKRGAADQASTVVCPGIEGERISASQAPDTGN